MAYFQDVLNTVFQVTGGAAMAREMQQIALSAGSLATAVSAVQTGIAGLITTMGPLAAILLGVAAVATVVKAAFDLMSTALKTFSEETEKLFHAGVILKNLGSTLTLPEVQRFADQVSRQTGVQRPELEEAAAQIGRTGVAGGNIERTLKSIADTARSTGRPLNEVAEAVEKGILGADRGLKAFGITLQDTGSRAANLELILQQLNLRFQGGAAAFRQTLPGSIEAMQASLQRFLSALGEQFAPAAIRVFNKIADVLDWLTDHVAQVADSIALILGGPLGLFLLHAAQASDAGKNPLAKVGAGGDPATEKTLLQVADNTRIMADSVFQQVLGGQGQIVEQAFGFMSARMAMTI